jgi:hypothetical protein
MFNVKEVHFSKNPFDIEGCDFVNFPYCKDKVEVKGFFCYKRSTVIIDLTQELDTIWQNFHTNTRRGIRRAEREDVKIRINYGYNQFFQIYKNFRRKKGINSIFENFGVGIVPLDVIKNNGTLFVADNNGEILGGIVFLNDTFRIEGWVGATKRLESEKENNVLISCAYRLTLWEAIKYAKEKGIKEFDFGGFFPENEAEKDPTKKGINSFKLSFGGEVRTHYSYEKSYSKSLLLAYFLYHLKKGISWQ